MTTKTGHVTDIDGRHTKLLDIGQVVANSIVVSANAYSCRQRNPLAEAASSPRYYLQHALGFQVHDVRHPHQFADIGPDVRRALAGRALVGHNAHVDVGVLRRELSGWQPPEVFDTLKLARRLLPGQPSYKLGALVTALALDEGLPAGLAPHRASYDVLVTARLFVRLAAGPGGNPVSLEELRGQAGNEKPGSTDETAALF